MNYEKEQKKYAIISVRDRLIQTTKTRNMNDLAPLITREAVLIEVMRAVGIDPVYKACTIMGKIINYRQHKYKGRESIEFIRDSGDVFNKCFYGFSIIQHDERR